MTLLPAGAWALCDVKDLGYRRFEVQCDYKQTGWDRVMSETEAREEAKRLNRPTPEELRQWEYDASTPERQAQMDEEDKQAALEANRRYEFRQSIPVQRMLDANAREMADHEMSLVSVPISQ